MECPYYHGNHDRRIVHQGNAQEVMMLKGRQQELGEITVQNLVISNVNHLKEFLVNRSLAGLNFYQLQQYFRDLNLPPIIMNYIEEKGVVPSDRMLQIRDSMQSMNLIVRPNMSQPTRLSGNLQQITQSEIQVQGQDYINYPIQQQQFRNSPGDN